MIYSRLFFFFFQAEDSIRDAQESRGLGDVYKRQGKKLKRNSGVSLLANASIVYSQIVNASAERYFYPAGRALFQDPGGTIRRAWDVAVAAAQAGITAKVLTPAEQNSAWVSGKVASHIEAVWWGPILKSTAPNSSGKWAVAHQPGAPGN